MFPPCWAYEEDPEGRGLEMRRHQETRSMDKTGRSPGCFQMSRINSQGMKLKVFRFPRGYTAMLSPPEAGEASLPAKVDSSPAAQSDN